MTTTILYVAWSLILVLSIPLALNLVPPNGFYGFRTAKTLSDLQIWRQANSFSGWVFLVASLIGLGITYFEPGFAENSSTLLLVGILVLATIVSFIYYLKFVARMIPSGQGSSRRVP